jgi:hypothetical protein
MQLDRNRHLLISAQAAFAHGAPKVFVTNYAILDTGWFFFNLLSTLSGRLTQ